MSYYCIYDCYDIALLWVTSQVFVAASRDKLAAQDLPGFLLKSHNSYRRREPREIHNQDQPRLPVTYDSLIEAIVHNWCKAGPIHYYYSETSAAPRFAGAMAAMFWLRGGNGPTESLQSVRRKGHQANEEKDGIFERNGLLHS